ncbi:hypothetical protein NIES21_33340 [Anabaenopsis circularis NIES-21]|uniref:DUF2281 domain-containing protein n=2 Tax=Nostocales TaxID=1161 RepID=A0A1Z4GJH0_9CYAN|nr:MULTISPECIES: DUF2281 domain-containing protein [Nostoc]AFY42484.1 hypothetical protein Nos7107_1852 [Nostoc sp. PCC 7107]BAY17496.1 hypothetical protein NIES21_33340 [Anabaenopsis circularis NIES-21]GBE90735.1 hypothetical protein NCWK1_0454 [Nostoc cycadae WK-1]
MSIIQTATEKMRSLPPQQQQEVLDFIEFLQNKIAGQNTNQEHQEPISFLSAAQQLAGCVDGGPGDLATNKQYLEGLGSE